MPEGALLAVDVGGGTQDLLLWEPGTAVENAVKLVLPAPTQIMARRLARHTARREAVFLTGRLMGGGPLTGAVRRHLAAGLAVFATPAAALTLHDNLATVEQWGVVLTDTPPAAAVPLVLGDIDLQSLQQVLSTYEIPLPAHYAVAVQDHGFSPDSSNREFRFRQWRHFLEQGGRLQDLAFVEPPAPLTRMRAVAETLPGALLMDTCTAGMRGALLEPAARERRQEGLTVLNIGNAHTFAALLRGDRLFGIYEHHTGLLTPSKLADQLRRFQEGTLKHLEIFDDKGHGCAIHPDYTREGPFTFTIITGPRRSLARDCPGLYAAPCGDMMLTGCFGLAAAWLEKYRPEIPGESLC